MRVRIQASLSGQLISFCWGQPQWGTCSACVEADSHAVLVVLDINARDDVRRSAARPSVCLPALFPDLSSPLAHHSRPVFIASAHMLCNLGCAMHDARLSPTSRLWSFSRCWSTRTREPPTRRKGAGRAQKPRQCPRQGQPPRPQRPQHRRGASSWRRDLRRRKWRPRPCDECYDGRRLAGDTVCARYCCGKLVV